MTRKVDGLGRIVLPIEMRRELGLKENSPVDIKQEGEKIIITNPVNTSLKEYVIENRNELLEMIATSDSIDITTRLQERLAVYNDILEKLEK